MSARTRAAAAGILVAVALLSTAAGSGVQEVTIGYRWTKGETVRYRMVGNTVNVISGLPGGLPDMKVEYAMTQVLRSSVEETGSGAARLRQAFEAIQMDISTPAGKLSYDSARPEASDANPDSAVMAKMFSAMLEQPYTVVISPSGTIEKVEGMSQIGEKIFQSLQASPGSAQMIGMLKGVFSDEGMRDMIAQAFPPGPGRAVKPGDAWETKLTTKNPLFGALASTTIATLKAIEGSGAQQIARVATTTTITQETAGPVATPMGINMTLGVSSGEGEILFDLAKQQLLRSTTRTIMPMTMGGSGPDGGALNMKAEVTAITTVELMPR